MLESLIDADPATACGAANYLLNANDHLARALRSRGRRWIPKFGEADGLVDPDEAATAALAHHLPSARSFSPTALQNFAACPYKFFLNALIRLSPREEAEAIDALDPLTRGSIIHHIQFEILSKLRDEKLLPVTAANREQALRFVDRLVEEGAKKFRDDLAPAIEKVWNESVDSIRADMREWLMRMADDPGWMPWRFELSFGLRDREQADPASLEEPVELDLGIKLRGSIDLVERNAEGHLRATDHKTGKVNADKGVAVGGGKVLQPLLYAMAVEKILKAPVDSGRLYFCTSRGGYEERVVRLDDSSRAQAKAVIDAISGALTKGFLPAAPGERECEWCDYRPVCGPYEEFRVARKKQSRLKSLKDLRELP